MRSSSTPLQVIASPWLLNGSHGLHIPFAFTLTNSRHSCNSYVVPLASTAVRILIGVRCLRVSIFMGGPFEMLMCVRAINVAKQAARHFVRGAVPRAALCLPGVRALGGRFFV